MFNRIKPLSAFIIPALLLLSSCGENKGAGNAADNQVMDFPVITIEPQSITLNSKYPATIEGEQNIEIRPKVDGFIEKIYVDEGATVRKGQPLFLINAPQYEQGVRSARAAIQIAEAGVNSAQMEVNKIRPLVDKKIISSYQLEGAQFDLESQQAQLARAKADLVNATTNLGYTQITSPVNGVIGTLPYKIGSLVSSNTAQPLTVVSNITNIYAYFSINEKEVLELAGRFNGPSTNASLAAMPPVSLILANGVEYSYPGKIETTSGLINTSTGSISVRANFPNPENTIRSGSSGVVTIPVTYDSAIVIPQKSTYEIQGKRFVYNVQDDGSVVSKPITVLSNNDGQFYIVTEGLAAGDKIAMEGLATLRDGLVIKPVMVNTDSLYQSINK
ncbi:efflux RND transporter periplasmic adaptor subunit [Albibacterium bauzanense]|uniref:Membrane fusion protein (Multidrug efflux system) n=1 Tax=Albibacterium bauzanense TaxID=653929 RepID=A0A4R1LU62_9SPHI|nr:efflux RND transporter periplasmic adaptor subunit [Albibacterium bauzanense]TCK80683.1 membrane fusion protein (multidrug efflux system) [Albibacterium bauzanense]